MRKSFLMVLIFTAIFILSTSINAQNINVSGVGNPSSANGLYVPYETVNGYDSWKHQSGEYYIYNGYVGEFRLWFIDGDVDQYNDNTLFYSANYGVETPLDVVTWDKSKGTGKPALNGVPKVIAPSAPTVYEDDIDVAISDDIQVVDEDNDSQTVTFTITGGTLTIGTAGITFGGSGNGSASFTASGTLAAINTALDAAKFTPTPNLFGTNAGKIEFISNDGKIISNTASVVFDIIRVKYPSPVILFINPENGPPKGETKVTITGMNFFVDLTEVYFGSVLVPILSIDETEIKIMAPSGAGTVDVTVKSAGGSNTTSFTYDPPSIISIFPSNGPAAGGTEVTITGINFTNAASVNFGFESVPFTFISDTIIKFTTPSSSGTVAVSITSGGVTSDAKTFTYNPPSIISISPSNGPMAGGTEVTITGINFTDATAVHFGSASTMITFISDTVIKVILPAGSGTVNVTVTSASGTSAGSLFTYFKATPVITWENPADITYGTALSGTQLNATADVAGEFVYTPASGTVLEVGFAQILKVDFTPDDTDNYETASKSVLINVTPLLPSVTTDSVTEITAGSAKGTGTVTDNGGSDITAKGVCFSENENPDTDDLCVKSGAASNSFIIALTELTPETLYYARAYATNSAGTSYGNQVDFTTLAAGELIPASELPTGMVVYDDTWTFNGNPLEWRVVHTNYGGVDGVTLSSTTGVGKKAYIAGGWNNKWPDSTMKIWLNTDFRNGFSPTFEEKVLDTDVPWVNTTIGGILTDKVFIASKTELGGDARTGDGNVFDWYSDAFTAAQRRGDVTGNPAIYWTRTGELGTYASAWYEMSADYVFMPAGNFGSGAWSSDEFETVPVVNIAPDTMFELVGDRYRLFIATPEVTWNATDIIYGQTLADSLLNGSSAEYEGSPVTGTFTFDNPSTAPDAGSADYTVTFTPYDLAAYRIVTGLVTVNVNKAIPVITWENPADITYGTALSGTQLNATVDVDGTFIYTPALGTFLDAGFSQILKVDFTPDDTDNYETVSKAVFVNVAPLPPSVTTDLVTDITSSAAKVEGTITSNGGSDVTEKGVCFSENENPDTTCYSDSSDGDSITVTFTGLKSGTTYHVRAYATNSAGTAYGSDESFTTVNQYTLTYTAGINGSLLGVTTQTVEHGQSGSVVNAVPDEGYHFVDWSDGVMTASRTDTNVIADISVTANFKANPVGICENPEEISTLPYTHNSTTTGRDSTITSYGDYCGAEKYVSGDYIYSIELKTGDKVEVTLTPAEGFDGVLALTNICGEDNECLQFVNDGAAGEAETIIHESTEDETIFIVVEGNEGAKGDYTLEVKELIEEADDDTVDDSDEEGDMDDMDEVDDIDEVDDMDEVDDIDEVDDMDEVDDEDTGNTGDSGNSGNTGDTGNTAIDEDDSDSDNDELSDDEIIEKLGGFGCSCGMVL